MMDKIDKHIQQGAGHLLDESVRQLDADTAYRLQLARGKALQETNFAQPARKRHFAMVAVSVVIALFVGVLVIQQPIKDQIGFGKGEEHRMSVEGPDEDALYEDLDFYIWLSSKEWPS